MFLIIYLLVNVSYFIYSYLTLLPISIQSFTYYPLPVPTPKPVNSETTNTSEQNHCDNRKEVTRKNNPAKVSPGKCGGDKRNNNVCVTLLMFALVNLIRNLGGIEGDG